MMQRFANQVFVSAPHAQPPLHSLYATFMGILLANGESTKVTNDMNIDGMWF
jgi:hypothetical protein